jgi:hypothetical protein
VPPAYTAFFFWLASAVLWWSGWRQETAGGIPDTAAALFLAGWPLAARLTLEPVEGLEIGGVVLWTGAAAAILLWRERGRALPAGLALGALAVMTAVLHQIRPDWPDWAAECFSALTVGALAAWMVNGAAGQMAAVTVASLLPDALAMSWLTDHGNGGIGSDRWMLGWWVSIAAARLTARLTEAAVSRVPGFLWDKEGDRT